MNTIHQIIKLLNSDKWYGVSNNIEIAKGKNKIKTLKEKKEHLKRKMFLLLK